MPASCVKDLGFQGRPNKAEDSCCSFWVGATLALLDEIDLVDNSRARRFHTICQNHICGKRIVVRS